MRIFASVRISHHISDSLWLCLLFPRCNTVKDFGNSEKRSSLLYLMMFLIYSLYLCLCACEYGSVFLMLDEEYNLLKKITDNFKRPKQTFFFFFFLKHCLLQRAGRRSEKSLWFQILTISPHRAEWQYVFFSPRFTWKPWEQSPSYSRPCKKAALKSTCLQIGDVC